MHFGHDGRHFVFRSNIKGREKVFIRSKSFLLLTNHNFPIFFLSSISLSLSLYFHSLWSEENSIQFSISNKKYKILIKLCKLFYERWQRGSMEMYN